MKPFFFALLLSLTTVFSSAAHAEEQDLSNNFVVVWTYITSDNDIVKDNIADQANSLLELWKQGIVENVYMNRDLIEDADPKNKRTITFFIKAETQEDASKVLDQMPFVQKKIAEYQLFPVGFLWLKAYEDKSEEK